MIMLHYLFLDFIDLQQLTSALAEKCCTELATLVSGLKQLKNIAIYGEKILEQRSTAVTHLTSSDFFLTR